MLVRFCTYSVLKNLRFADPFLAIYFLQLGLDYTVIGALLGCQRLVTALLEIPSGFVADQCGRRRALASSFALHFSGLTILAIGAEAAARPSLFWFYAGLSVYGAGEAMRTGSHKAIMLDYLDSQGLSDRATSVLGTTRMFSKSSSALAGLAAGGILYLSGDYATLFWASAAAALGGMLLILSYPKYLEGESTRRRSTSQESSSRDATNPQPTAWSMFRSARVWLLLLQSAIYESQVEIVLKLLLQPFLYLGLNSLGYALPSVSNLAASRGGGSLVVGVNELFRDGLGAAGARGSVSVERRSGGKKIAINYLYIATIVCIAAAGLCALNVSALLLPGAIAIGLLTLLQNFRRPIFVSLLNEYSSKPLRATVLSIDSQSRSIVAAVMMPLVGMAADAWGLWAVCGITVGVMILGTPLLRNFGNNPSIEKESTSEAPH